jgi:hypothetical protein
MQGSITSSPQGKSLNKPFKRNVQPFSGCLIKPVSPKPVCNQTALLEAIPTPAVQMPDSVQMDNIDLHVARVNMSVKLFATREALLLNTSHIRSKITIYE